MTLAALCMAVPLLSLAWRNESAARKDERQQRILALQKAAEAFDQRALKPSSTWRLPKTNVPQARAQEAKANVERERAEKALTFLVETFRKPDPSVDGRTLKVVDLLDQAVKDIDKVISRPAADESNALECDR